MENLQNFDSIADASPVSIAPPPPHKPANVFFMGRFGLRAGWAMLIFALVLVIVTFILSLATLAATGKLKTVIAERRQEALARQNHTPPPPVKVRDSSKDENPRPALIGETLQFAAVALAAWVLCRIERRRFAVYGIGRYRIRDFLPGTFWGIASLSVLVGILRAFHFLVFDGRALFGAAIFIFAVKWLVVFLFVGLFEEYLTRGYLQYTLTRGFFGLGERLSATHARAVAFWLAAFIMSCVFAAGHLGNKGENFMGITMVFVAGVTFSYALWRTGSLWWAIGFHMSWDWAQSFLWGVPDSGHLSGGRLFLTHPVGNILLSGGTDGPEGSVFVIPILLLVMVVIRFTPRGEQPPLEPLPALHSVPPEIKPVLA